MSNNNFIILGIQRTGTTLLKNLLDSHPDIACLDEVLLFKEPKGNLGYLNYKQFKETHRSKTLSDYLDYVFNKTNNKKAVGFKLMYDQTTPGNIRLLKEFSVKILHVIRKNNLQTLISNKRTSLDIYQTRDEIKAAEFLNKKITIDVNKLRGEIEKVRVERYELYKLIRDEFKSVRLFYDDFSSDYNCESIKEALRFLGVSSTIELKTDFLKVGHNTLKEAVTNYDEVVEFLVENYMEDLLY